MKSLNRIKHNALQKYLKRQPRSQGLFPKLGKRPWERGCLKRVKSDNSVNLHLYSCHSGLFTLHSREKNTNSMKLEIQRDSAAVSNLLFTHFLLINSSKRPLSCLCKINFLAFQLDIEHTPLARSMQAI